MKRRTIITGLIATMAYGGFVCAQDKDAKTFSRYPNVSRIRRVWDSLAPLSKKWNRAMDAAAGSLTAYPPGRVVDTVEQAKRVAWYKDAREASIKQAEALSELIDEEGEEDVSN